MKTELTQSGFGAWPISDESRIIERPDGIYARPIPTEATLITDRVPDFMDGIGDKLQRQPDGKWALQTDWGVSEGTPGEAFFVKYGVKSNGEIDANILTVGTPSFAEYTICTPDGQDIMRPDGQPWTLSDAYEASINMGLSWDQVEAMWAESVGESQSRGMNSLEELSQDTSDFTQDTDDITPGNLD